MGSKLTAGMRRILQSDTNRNHEIQQEVIRLAKSLRKQASGSALCALLKAKGIEPFCGKPRILQDWNAYCRVVAYYGEDLIRDITEVRCRKQIIDVHDQVFALSHEASLPLGKEVTQWLRSKLQANASKPVEKRKALGYFIREANRRQSPRKPASKPGGAKGTVSSALSTKSGAVVRPSHNEPDAVMARWIDAASTIVRLSNRPDLRQNLDRLSLEDVKKLGELQSGVQGAARRVGVAVEEVIAERLDGVS